MSLSRWQVKQEGRWKTQVTRNVVFSFNILDVDSILGNVMQQFCRCSFSTLFCALVALQNLDMMARENLTIRRKRLVMECLDRLKMCSVRACQDK